MKRPRSTNNHAGTKTVLISSRGYYRFIRLEQNHFRRRQSRLVNFRRSLASKTSWTSSQRGIRPTTFEPYEILPLSRREELPSWKSGFCSPGIPVAEGVPWDFRVHAGKTVNFQFLPPLVGDSGFAFIRERSRLESFLWTTLVLRIFRVEGCLSVLLIATASSFCKFTLLLFVDVP